MVGPGDLAAGQRWLHLLPIALVRVPVCAKLLVVDEFGANESSLKI